MKGSESISTYSVDKYISKKQEDITKDIPAIKMYQLGIAVGMHQCYKAIEKMDSQETADKCFKHLDSEDEYTTIFRTLIGLEHEEYKSKVEEFVDKIHHVKEKDIVMSDEDRDLLESVIECLHKKNK